MLYYVLVYHIILSNSNLQYDIVYHHIICYTVLYSIVFEQSDRKLRVHGKGSIWKICFGGIPEPCYTPLPCAFGPLFERSTVKPHFRNWAFLADPLKPPRYHDILHYIISYSILYYVIFYYIISSFTILNYNIACSNSVEMGLSRLWVGPETVSCRVWARRRRPIPHFIILCISIIIFLSYYYLIVILLNIYTIKLLYYQTIILSNYYIIKRLYCSTIIIYY